MCVTEAAFKNASQQENATQSYPKNWFAYVSQMMFTNIRNHHVNKTDTLNFQNGCFVLNLFKFIHYSVNRIKIVLNMQTNISLNSLNQNELCIKSPCGILKVMDINFKHKEKSTHCSLRTKSKVHIEQIQLLLHMEFPSG